MPRPLSSSRYLRRRQREAEVKRNSKKDTTRSTIDPLTSAPSYLSIIWLASKVTNYGQSHMSSSGVKGHFYIGQGATFVVYRSLPSQVGNDYAIKRPIITFGANQGEKDTLKQLYSLHLELRVLSDLRIRSHPNIVKLQTVVWEEHPDDIGRFWPSLVIEYANFETLSRFYENGMRPSSFKRECEICIGIGDGLKFLHENGVVHGDIKPENILMFHDKSTGIVTPKLADFGYSFLDGDNAPVLPLGTFPWAALEIGCNDVVGINLTLADTFSFGLLVWYISKDGVNPFECREICPFPTDTNEARKQIAKLKENNSICQIAIASIPREKEVYKQVFQSTLSSDLSRRDLQKALQSLQAGSSTSIDQQKASSTTKQTLHNRTNMSGVRCSDFFSFFQFSSRYYRPY
jgi:serine/threonine protein kinase